MKTGIADKTLFTVNYYRK